MHFSGIFAVGRKMIDYLYRPTDQAVLPSYNTAGNITYNPYDFQQGLITRDCNGAARSDTTPTAQQILDSLTVNGRPPVPGNAYYFTIKNTSGTAVAITILAGTGVTLVGTMTIAQSNARTFMVLITGIATPAVTLHSIGGSAF